MGIKGIYFTIMLLVFSANTSAKNVCTQKSFDGLNAYIEKSFAQEEKAQKLYDKKIAEFKVKNIDLISKRSVSLEQLTAYYQQAEPAALANMKQQESYIQQWSDEFNEVGKSVNRCISRLTKVTKTLNKLYNSCKRYAHIEGMTSSQNNIDIVKEELASCNRLKKSYTYVNKQITTELQLFKNIRKKAKQSDVLP